MITIRFRVRLRVFPNLDNFWTITTYDKPYLLPWLEYERFPE